MLLSTYIPQPEAQTPLLGLQPYMLYEEDSLFHEAEPQEEQY